MMGLEPLLGCDFPEEVDSAVDWQKAAVQGCDKCISISFLNCRLNP
jgi:hypothetical protein